tara:strand:- start:866 stop:1057 length:192 start_codon:yes stop_codon:yes gene_type:complete
VQHDFSNQNNRRAAPMPRPKTELTKSGRAIGIRLTESEYQQWLKLGATKWLRKLLQEKRDASV